MRRLALVALLLAGCGGGGEPAATVVRPAPWAARDCTVAGLYRACYHSTPTGRSRTAIEYRRDTGWKRLRVPHPTRKPGQPAVGHWAWVAESPDGGTLLAQWSAECEVPVAFVVPAAGGRARAVAQDRHGPATSTALGWTTDGRAVVDLPSGACGGGVERPGVYLIAPDTGERDWWKPTGSVERSLEPRDVG